MLLTAEASPPPSKVMFLKIIFLVSLDITFSIFFNGYFCANCTMGTGTQDVEDSLRAPICAFMSGYALGNNMESVGCSNKAIA